MDKLVRGTGQKQKKRKKRGIGHTPEASRTKGPKTNLLKSEGLSSASGKRESNKLGGQKGTKGGRRTAARGGGKRGKRPTRPSLYHQEISQIVKGTGNQRG